jgi:hypothetical protein
MMNENSHPDIDTSSTSRDKTHPFEIVPRQGKKPKRVAWLIALLILVVIVEVVLLIKKHSVGSAELNRLEVQLKINEIKALDAEVRRKQQQMWERALKLKESRGLDLDGWNFTKPTPEQVNILRETAQSGDEDAVFIREGMVLLNALSQRIADIAAPLGPPHIVSSGESHFRLALHFLTETRKIPEDEARRILTGLNLQEPLLPGFFVWNFWFEDGFSTFVTRGDAPITPEEAEQQALNSAKAERERALIKLNSLRYLVGSVGRLQERGILEGGLFKKTKLGTVRSRDFRHAIDLRRQRTISIYSRSVNLEKISSLTIYPDEFKKDQDFKLHLDSKGRQARVEIINPRRFKNRDIVIAVE